MNDMLLTQTQQREWPGSVMLSDDQLIARLTEALSHYRTIDDKPVDWAARVRSARHHYPLAVSYTVVDGTGKVGFGMRFGHEAHQYLSF